MRDGRCSGSQQVVGLHPTGKPVRRHPLDAGETDVGLEAPALAAQSETLRPARSKVPVPLSARLKRLARKLESAPSMSSATRLVTSPRKRRVRW